MSTPVVDGIPAKWYSNTDISEQYKYFPKYSLRKQKWRNIEEGA